MAETKGGRLFREMWRTAITRFGSTFLLMIGSFYCVRSGAAVRENPPVKQAGSSITAKNSNSSRIRVAEGEYQVYKPARSGGIGPFSPSVYNFTESWALWKLPDNTYEVRGTRQYDAPEYEPHMDSFLVKLSPEFSVLQITEYKKLQWRPDSGPLTCVFDPGKLDCSSGAKDPQQEIRLTVPLQPSYGFLWPISAFSLGNITRFADHRLGRSIAVDMLTLDEPDRADPVLAMILEGNLRTLGREQIRVAGQQWMASKFELKVPMYPAFMIWTSPQGLLLDFAQETNQRRLTESGMKLVAYKQFAAF